MKTFKSIALVCFTLIVGAAPMGCSLKPKPSPALQSTTSEASLDTPHGKHHASEPGDAVHGHHEAHTHEHNHGHAHAHEHKRKSQEAHAKHSSDSPTGHSEGHHKRFKDAQTWSKRFDDPKRDQWQKPDHAVLQLKLGPGMTVADIGAGTGYFISRLAQAVGPTGRVLALDVESDMVRFMNERIEREGIQSATAKRVQGDDPLLSAESVDRILIVDTWHHISNRSAYAAKLAAALRPGGFVAVVDFTMDSPKGPPKKHRLLPEDVARELESAGLKTAIVEEELPNQYIVTATRP